MIPIIILVIAWWAGSGVVASVKAARATSPATTKGAAAATRSTGNTPPTGQPAAPGGATFGQWQRAAYGRWKSKIRAATFGKHRGNRAVDVIGDGLAAVLAGATVFGLGFATGTAWAGTRRTRNGTRKQSTGQPGSRRASSPKPPKASRRQPRRGPRSGKSGPGFKRTPGPESRPQGSAPPPSPGRRNSGSDTVLDFELTDDYTQPTTGPSRFSSDEYADVILPALPAHPTTSPAAPNGTNMASEILTIHHLLRWAQGAFEHAVNVIEQSAVRASSAIERASHALVRSNTAIARRETAIAVADTAHQHATQLEETAARFSTLRMDQASMTSIGVGITTAVGLAQAEQRRAEAEAAVADRAAALAAAEQVAAEAAQASAQAAAVHAEAVKGMHDTVRLHQMPHAEALAATGNDAAHPSVLAAG